MNTKRRVRAMRDADSKTTKDQVDINWILLGIRKHGDHKYIKMNMIARKLVEMDMKRDVEETMLGEAAITRTMDLLKTSGK